MSVQNEYHFEASNCQCFLLPVLTGLFSFLFCHSSAVFFPPSKNPEQKITSVLLVQAAYCVCCTGYWRHGVPPHPLSPASASFYVTPSTVTSANCGELIYLFTFRKSWRHSFRRLHARSPAPACVKDGKCVSMSEQSLLLPKAASVVWLWLPAQVGGAGLFRLPVRSDSAGCSPVLASDCRGGPVHPGWEKQQGSHGSCLLVPPVPAAAADGRLVPGLFGCPVQCRLVPSSHSQTGVTSLCWVWKL